ncbi:MAG: dUTP diphosphatase, partial [Oscillospiraceae bacterium]|nr:dUTP diphosphatase [Oscillospiraceae bacterium]
PITIFPNAQAVIPTGIAVAIPEGYVGIMAVRSSMGVRNSVSLSNDIGVIDADYRGPLGVGLRNNGGAPYTVQSGDRIAQLLVVPVLRPEIETVEELPATQRGEHGFGSTGR